LTVPEPPLISLPPRNCDNLNIRSDILPIEFVACPSGGAHLNRDHIMIYSIHGGDVIPEVYYRGLGRVHREYTVPGGDLERLFALEKDWGANQVAASLARHLDTGGYWRVNIARVLMDFGRFPGITRTGSKHLDRYAINYPFSHALDFKRKRLVLENCYDSVSDVFERETPGKIIKLGIHSYDYHNPLPHPSRRGTIRPEVSLIYRSASFQKYKHMPYGQFDPLYPDRLGEFTANRRLTSRISLMLEKAGVPVSTNFPYYLPDGSVEVRSQVWSFFNYLKKLFGDEHPHTREDPAYMKVWDMLLDTNLRRTDSESLRSFLHMYRNAPRGLINLFKAAQHAYEHIGSFVEERNGKLISYFRDGVTPCSAIALEVRKDLIWSFHDDRTWHPKYGPDGLRTENVELLSKLLAESIKTYMEKDRHLDPVSPLAD